MLKIKVLTQEIRKLQELKAFFETDGETLWLIDRLTDCVTNKLTDRPTNKPTDVHEGS